MALPGIACAPDSVWLPTVLPYPVVDWWTGNARTFSPPPVSDKRAKFICSSQLSTAYNEEMNGFEGRNTCESIVWRSPYAWLICMCFNIRPEGVGELKSFSISKGNCSAVTALSVWRGALQEMLLEHMRISLKGCYCHEEVLLWGFLLHGH